MSKELAKTYNPKEIEDKTYEKWCENKYFHAEIDRSRKPFTTVMPPPNITGKLHMGHALDNTLQDILIRYKRMEGYNALWIPGTDHAAISTEVKVTNQLKEEGIDKKELGREGFLERTWRWKEEYAGTIENQLKKLGISCDWDRERFTMDEGCSRAVEDVFIKLYEKGYIYKGSRIINWCPVCKTSLSDAEVEHEEQDGFFWHIKYPIAGTDRFLEIATTRPETMLGDTAIAVHPDDERYSDIVGKTAVLPLVNREIPIVADYYVDKEFGTGAVKITPAHDPNDFEVGKRHNLEEINIMNDDATINEKGGKYAGMERYEARKAIVADLEAQGYLVKIEPHSHNVGTHDRCSTTVEPLIKQQWFVKMEELAKPAINALKTGELKFVPERFDKIYLHWLENIKDWCISRQIWWGHRIPAYYCDQCGEFVVAKEVPQTCPHCGCSHFTQDEDTLDTWFSSALWPFSTLGWPEKTEDLDYFYPTDVLVTGYDIIFFWVIRMVFSGFEHTGRSPFHTVLIHGLVRDSQGRKMSKSLGNGIDPLEIIDQYGADALRFTLATGNSPGNDMRFSDERVQASRNFCNKIWNASRFIQMNLTIDKDKAVELPSDLAIEDKWIISKFNRKAADISQLRMVQWAFRVILFICGTKVTVIGEENVPKDEAVLYIGNHKSYFDIIITYARCPGLTGYVAKNDMAKVPLLSLWMKRLYCLFINRDDVKEALKTILAGIDHIKNGISMCIFPEGTRNKTDDLMLPFKEGSFKMAEKTGCAIVPMAITGSADILENHFPKVKATHVILEYGKPIYPNELDKETKKKIGAHCQGIIEEMLVKNEKLR